jgi:hypothetical protein
MICKGARAAVFATMCSDTTDIARRLGGAIM